MIAIVAAILLIATLILLSFSIIHRKRIGREVQGAIWCVFVLLAGFLSAGVLIPPPPNIPPTGASTATIRPNGLGTSSIWLDYPSAGAAWEKVDDTGGGDGDSTYVYLASTTQKMSDLYAAEDFSAPAGSYDITSVKVYFRGKYVGGGSGAKCLTWIRTHSTNYAGASKSLTSSYVLYSTTYTTNPYTSAAWTDAEVDALEIGVNGSSYYMAKIPYWSDPRVTQVYAEVEYSVPAVLYTDNGVNQTQAREVCEFSVKMNATGGNIDGHIFSTNNTSVWRNDTWVDMGGDSQIEWGNTSKLLFYNAGARVEYKWYANTTLGEWEASDTYNFTTTEETGFVSFNLPCDGYTADYAEWTGDGDSPYLHTYGDHDNVTSDVDGEQTGWYTFEDIISNSFEDLGNHTYFGTLNLTFTIRISGGATSHGVFVQYYTPNRTYVSTYQSHGSIYWTNYTISLLGNWTVGSINDFQVRFESEIIDKQVSLDYCEVGVGNEFWSRARMISWLWGKTVDRKVNATFPYVKRWNVDAEAYTVARPELLAGANIYKIMDNNTAFLESAYETANWLSGKPICRLWQEWNVTTESWINEERLAPTAELFALTVLVNVNSSYSSLLQAAADNFTKAYFLGNGLSLPSKIDGTRDSETLVTCSGHATACAAVFYAGVALDNQTLMDFAIDSFFAYNASDLYIWYNQLYQDGMCADEPAKEDMSFGYPVLAGLMMYGYSGNITLKNYVENMTKASTYFWKSDAGENGRFIYRVHADTGAHYITSTVHGFGLLEEALIQGYLVWDNATWLQQARDDWLNLVVNGTIVLNGLICHQVSVGDAIGEASEDSNDYWNSAAKRTGQLFYNLNVTGYYHNATFLKGYEKLYSATSHHHKLVCGDYGWIQVVDAGELTPFAGELGYPWTTDFSVVFRNFQCKSVAINDFSELYSEFGNPFTGEEYSITQPTLLATGWNEISPWDVDVTHTLAEINTSIWNAGIELFGITYINSTGYYEFHYNMAYNAGVKVFSVGDTLRLFCNTAGSWYHDY